MTGSADRRPTQLSPRRLRADRRRIGTATMVMSVAALLAGCAQPQQVIQSGTVGANSQVGDVLLRNVYIENPTGTGYPGGSDATVRLTIINQASRPDALTTVTTDVAARVVILADTDCDGTPETLPRLELPARIDLSSPPNAPGPTDAGYFLRLLDLKVGILQGTSVPITFVFSRAGSVTLLTPVDGTAAHAAGTAAPRRTSSLTSPRSAPSAACSAAGSAPLPTS
jgi:copper(I)-binding protein